tara:strand:+ start:297 stop:725 length:429 start_codon:yes stop_codon:yes gene_type:complete
MINLTRNLTKEKVDHIKDLVDKIDKDLFIYHGGTYDIELKDIPLSGYCVGGFGEEIKFPIHTDESKILISDFISKYYYNLMINRYNDMYKLYIGAWRDDDDNCVLDIVYIENDLNKAINLGEQLKQKAIFDLAYEKEIKLQY